MKANQVTVLVLFIIAALILASAVFSGSAMKAAQTIPLLQSYFPALGMVLALLGGICLLVRALGGSSLAELSPLVLPVLAGSLVAHPTWSSALGLGLLGVAVIVREVLAQTTPKREPRGNRNEGARRRGPDRRDANRSDA